MINNESEVVQGCEAEDGSSYVILIQNDDHNEYVDYVEHICTKCKKSFKTLSHLNKHLASCRDPALSSTTEDSVRPSRTRKSSTPVILNTSNSKVVKALTKNDPEKIARPTIKPSVSDDCVLCFCCNEPLEGAHMGHIQCKLCMRLFKSLKGKLRHMEMLHSKCEDFKCEQCPVQCPNKDILEKHLEAHKSTGKPFSCPTCSKDFTRKYHLERHMKSTTCNPNLKPSKDLQCEVCKKTFTRLDNLREHLRGHMGQKSRKRDFPCPMCDKSFYGLSLLNIHIRSHTGERPFNCDLCEKAFPSNGALRKHRRVHTGERPYQCSVCLSRFAVKEVLNRHMKIHTGEKKYICSVCGEKFIQSNQLRNHMFHHTGKSNHNCTICDVSFDRKARLVKHMHEVHDQALQCQTCSSLFLTEEELETHSKRHDSIYYCEECQIDFPSKQELGNHLSVCPNLDGNLKQTIEEWPIFTCTHCDQTFKRVDLLKRHEKSHAKEILESINGPEREIESQDSDIKTSPAEKKPITRKRKASALSDDEKDAIFNRLRNDLETKSSNLKSYPSNLNFKYSDKMLVTSLIKLLKIFFDEEMLAGFGWPEASIEMVLKQIISHLGLKFSAVPKESLGDRLRGMMKEIFSTLLDEETYETQTNNYTMDEMIQNIICEYCT